METLCHPVLIISLSVSVDRPKIYAHDDLDTHQAYNRRMPVNPHFPRRTQLMPNSYRPGPAKTPLEPFAEELPVTSHHLPTTPEVPRRTHGTQRRLHFSNAVYINDQPSGVPRGGGVRRLPPTPAQPSLLNIDNLTQDPNLSNKSRDLLGADLFNFPRLETSPTRMKMLLQSVGRLKSARSTAPDETTAAHQQTPRNLPPSHAMGTWSRSLDDPLTFEEAVIAGRGTRQLPVIGPQQLLQGRGGGGRSLNAIPMSQTRRELPRPGTSVDLTMTNGSQRMNVYPQTIYDSDEDEDWC